MSKPKRYRIFHVAPGLVQYTSDGQEHLVLLKRETLDAMNQSFVEKPVFNENHMMVDAADAFVLKSGNREDLAVGIVHDAGCEEWSGRYWVDASIWDDETQDNIDEGYGVSNAYIVKKSGPGGIHNSITYDEEVLEAQYHHLAIVSNPRYSDTQIIQNSKSGGIMKFKLNWGKKAEKSATPEVKETAVEEVVMNSDATLDVDGESIAVGKMVKAYQNMKAEEEEKEKEKENATVGMDDTIEVDGETVSVKDLLKAYKAKTAEGDEKEEDKKEEDVKENSTTEKSKSFKMVENALNETVMPKAPKVETEVTRLARGQASYSSIVKKEDANVV